MPSRYGKRFNHLRTYLKMREDEERREEKFKKAEAT